MSFTKSQFAINVPLIALLGLASLFILYIPQVQSQSCDLNSGFKDGAEQFVTVRRSQRRGAKNKAEILWQPQDMLKDPTCYAVQAAELEMRQENTNTWEIADVTTKPHGKQIKWTVKTKPCLKYYFRIKVTGNDINSSETSLELPPSLALEPVSEENILKSGYTPDPPTGFTSVVSSGTAELSWEASDCATTYEIYYMEAGEGEAVTKNTNGQTSGSVSGLKPCTRYDTVISAVLGDKYGELSTEFATEPHQTEPNLDVKTTPGLNSVRVSWPSWLEVSCIDKYNIKACDSNDVCTADETIQKFVGSPHVNHEVTGLKPCTDYTLHIKPLFKELNIEEKVVQFRTKSMDASQLHIDRVSSETTDGAIHISWSPVACASKYKVYQKEIGVEGLEPIEVGERDATESTEFPVSDITPCTKYQFGISAVVLGDNGEETETEKMWGSEVMSDLDANSFKLSRQHISTGDDHVNIQWGHADCIASYKVKSCNTGQYTDCTEEIAVMPNNGDDKMISHTFEGLTACTPYELHVTAVNDQGQFMAEPIAVRTTNGTPEAPEFEVEFVPGSGVNVKWNEANCATGYKVYYKVEADENEAVADASNSELMKAFEETTACQTYLYSVTTLVNEEESTRIGDNWKNVLIPPKASAKPSIKLVTTDHDNVTLQISPAEDNKQCKIDLYKIVYSSGCCDLKESCESKTVEFTPEEAQDGQVLLNLEGAAHADTIYKAQVSYGNEWSEVASFGVQSCPVDEPEPVKFPLIPVVVGVAVLALVIIVVTVLLVKRSRNRNLDPEKAENGNAKNHHQNLVNSDEEETQKLNDAHA